MIDGFAAEDTAVTLPLALFTFRRLNFLSEQE